METSGPDPSLDYLDWQPQPLPAPWVLVPTAERGGLEAELHAELAEAHPLSGQRAIAIARCLACDDVVFFETDLTRFVRVHLTWRSGPEPPPWPTVDYLDLPLSSSLAEHVH